MRFTLRPATADDAEFLFALHAATMRDAVNATWGWDEAWQRDYFHAQFLPERIQMIEVSGETVGMLERVDQADECFIANVKILPAFQGSGLGTAVLRSVLASAARRQVPVRLQVLRANPDAQRLYQRLGFAVIDQTDTHVMMLLPVAHARTD